MQNLNELKSLCAQIGADFSPREQLAPHTTFRVGGPCAALVSLPNSEACRTAVQYLRRQRIPFRLIGRGSNLLVPDSGYSGVVLKLGGVCAESVTVQPDGKIVCGAGMPLKNLCVAARNASLSGLEFAYGIPGTVGGAVFMNAGAYGGEIANVLTEVQILDENSVIRTVPAAELSLSYRHSILMERDWLVLTATVQLQTGEKSAINASMQDYLSRRHAKQPLEYASAGSTFKRPAADQYASRLIDQCGLKGYRVGGAQVSEKHAGFVINRGGATFAEIMAVCRHVQNTVKEQTGFLLELEPEILGADIMQG